MLLIKNYSFAYKEKTILKNVNLKIEDGEFLTLLGPNGSGKTTLMRAILGELRGKSSGDIFLNDKPLRSYSEKERAKEIAAVFQFNHPNFDYTAKELVEMARYPYLGRFGDLENDDYEIIKTAMEDTGVWGFRNRSFKEISGGELQRVMIARALAQEAKLLILDEPVNHLDMKYKLIIMSLLAKLNKERKKTIAVILHDVNLAALYSDSIAFIKKGVVFEKGSPDELITEKMIYEIYDTKVRIIDDCNRPVIVPLPS